MGIYIFAFYVDLCTLDLYSFIFSMMTFLGAISPRSPTASNTLMVSSSAELGKHVSSVSPIYVNSGTTPALLQQIEQLRMENVELKSNNHEMLQKVSKVSILEQEMSKIHQAYQGLLKHSEKRELLEKSARSKLQAVILSLSEANKVIYINIYIRDV